jgi:hypothetical protein
VISGDKMELWESLLVSTVPAIIAAIGTYILSRKQFNDQLRLQFDDFQNRIKADRQSLVEEKLMDKKVGLYEEVLQTGFELNVLLTPHAEVRKDVEGFQEYEKLIEKHRRSVWTLMLYEKDDNFIIKLTDLIEIESQLCDKYDDESYKIFMEGWQSVADNMRSKLGFSVIDFEKHYETQDKHTSEEM